MKPITTVTQEGQEYLDEPVYVHRKEEPSPEIAASVRAAFNIPEPMKFIHTGYQRVKLRWMKPGPDGKLVPR